MISPDKISSYAYFVCKHFNLWKKKCKLILHRRMQATDWLVSFCFRWSTSRYKPIFNVKCCKKSVFYFFFIFTSWLFRFKLFTKRYLFLKEHKKNYWMKKKTVSSFPRNTAILRIKNRIQSHFQFWSSHF